jgi:predicted dehydrogenase
MANFDLKVDLCDAIGVRFDGGTIGTVASTGGIPASQAANGQHELRLYGTRGYAIVDAVAGTCAIFYNDGLVDEFEQVPADRRYPQAATSRHLVDLVTGALPAQNNASPGSTGLRTVELLEAAYRSADGRRNVSVDELYADELYTVD